MVEQGTTAPWIPQPSRNALDRALKDLFWIVSFGPGADLRFCMIMSGCLFLLSNWSESGNTVLFGLAVDIEIMSVVSAGGN